MAPAADSASGPVRPRVVVVGLGPAGPELVTDAARLALAGAARRFLRTTRHPAAVAAGPCRSFDDRYERAATFDEVYAGIVEDLVTEARAVAGRGDDGTGGNGGGGGDGGAYVAYAVPGSPLVAERTVELLRADPRVETRVLPALSFLDLAWERLGVDPVAAGVRLVDGTDFRVRAAGQTGPLLVAQVHSRGVLSDVKLAAGDEAPPVAVVLHHLGLPDEAVLEVAWDDLDRAVPADHLTSLWIGGLAAPVASEVTRLEELVRTLRARCPWDMRQTHGSLARHLLEEAHETLDAIEDVAAGGADPGAVAVDHLEEELGDLLFQVCFHSVLAAEEGWFDLADVARSVHDKLVGRHPHVFGDAEAETPEAVAARWEVLKQAEKGRASVFDGIPDTLPALALAAKYQRKAQALGVALPGGRERLEQLAAAGDDLAVEGGLSGETLEGGAAQSRLVGEMLFALSDVARRLGVDPETALRAEARRFRQAVEPNE